MASKLVIIKSVRPSIDVPFFTQSAEAKASVQAEEIPVAAGERTFKQGLVKLRTLFFPTLAGYNQWATSSTVATTRAAKAAHDEANGIVETIKEVDLPGYSPLA
jgi:hypothetical protein